MLVKKNIVILHPADKSACAFYRCDAMAALLRSDRSDEVEVIVSRAEITDDYILKYTAAIVMFLIKSNLVSIVELHYDSAHNHKQQQNDHSHVTANVRTPAATQ